MFCAWELLFFTDNSEYKGHLLTQLSWSKQVGVELRSWAPKGEASWVLKHHPAPKSHRSPMLVSPSLQGSCDYPMRALWLRHWGAYCYGAHGSTVLSRVCLCTGQLGWRGGWEAGLVIISTGGGRCAEAPRLLCSAEATPGPDVSLKGLPGTCQACGSSSSCPSQHCHCKEKAPPSQGPFVSVKGPSV